MESGLNWRQNSTDIMGIFKLKQAVLNLVIDKTTPGPDRAVSVSAAVEIAL